MDDVGAATATKPLQLTTADGLVACDIELTRVEARPQTGKQEKPTEFPINLDGEFPRPETAQDKRDELRSSSRHLAAVRTKEYLDEHVLQNVIEAMVREVLVKKPVDPLKFMVDHLLSKCSKGGEDVDLRTQMAQVLGEAAHWREACQMMEKQNADKEQQMQALASQTRNLEEQMAELKRTEYSLNASQQYGMELHEKNLALQQQVDKLNTTLQPGDLKAEEPKAEEAAPAEAAPAEEPKAEEAAPAEEPKADKPAYDTLANDFFGGLDVPAPAAPAEEPKADKPAYDT